MWSGTDGMSLTKLAVGKKITRYIMIKIKVNLFIQACSWVAYI